MRKVIVHYHLFKNAGSSVDSCLRESFDNAWLAFDPDVNQGAYTARQLQQIISEHPHITAFSSHCLVPPILQEPTSICPIIILREPISRVLSAYKFEWQKQLGAKTPIGELGDYIQEKLSLRRRNAIENFQTMRLAVTDPDERNPDFEKSDDELVNSACQVIDSLPAFGLVEYFDKSVAWLQHVYQVDFPELCLQPVSMNETQDSSIPLAQRHRTIADAIGEDLYTELVMCNQLDIQLYAYSKGRFNALASQTNPFDSSDDTATSTQSVA